MKNSFESLVYEAVKKFNMIISGDRILVGLSGGKDSAALLHFLASYKDTAGIEVYAFHLNHMIRGDEALRDAEFSEKLCRHLGIQFTHMQIDVPKYAQNNKMGLEEAARKCRYDAFDAVCKKFSCNKIATAHTASDNCETVLYNLIRGAGRVNGIPPVRGNIIRPLIYVTTEQVLEYCASHAIEYVYDSTNSDLDYSRNYIRGRVIPLLKELNPSLEKALAIPSHVSFCDREYFDAKAEAFIKEFSFSDGSVKLSELQKLAADEKNSSIFYCVISKLSHVALENIHIENIKKLILGGNHGKKSELPGMRDMTILYDRVLFTKRNEQKMQDFHIKLCEGLNEIPNSPFAILVEKGNFSADNPQKDINYKNINKLAKKICLDWNKITSELYIRGRLSGDSYVAGNIRRSVKKYLIDMKVPKIYRDAFPIVCDNKGIVWIPGLPIADRVSPDGMKKGYLSLVVKKG